MAVFHPGGFKRSSVSIFIFCAALLGVRRGCSILFLALFALSQSGCTVWRPIPLVTHTTKPVPPELLSYYDYPKLPFEATILKEETRKHYRFRQVEIPLYLPESMEIKKRNEWEKEVFEIQKTDEKTARDLRLQYMNRLDIYLPLKHTGPRPLILISPITGGNMVVDLFAKSFARHGYVAVIVERKKPFYDETRGPEQVEQYLRTSVIRLRQAVDWLEIQPEVDSRRMGAFGISYGAVMHSILAAIEPRIRYHVLAMPAAPLPEVILDCPDAGIRKLVVKLEKLGWSRGKILSELRRTIRTDPMVFAPYVPKDRVVVFWALFDRVVGSSRTRRLWRRMGRPTLKIIPLGHYGGILALPYLQYASLRFFGTRL